MTSKHGEKGRRRWESDGGLGDEKNRKKNGGRRENLENVSVGENERERKKKTLNVK